MDFMNKETKSELKFIVEYAQLCHKYGVYVGTIGCVKHLRVFTSESDKEIDDYIDNLLNSYRQNILRVFEPSDSLRKLLPQALAKLEEAEY
jgi:hypothetical protein